MMTELFDERRHFTNKWLRKTNPMRTIVITLALVATLGTQAGAEIQFPKTKYEIFDCITAIDPSWIWFGKTARVEDVVCNVRLPVGHFTY